MAEEKKTGIKEVEKKAVETKKEVKAAKGNASKIRDLKIELLKNPTKKKSIKREIARLLTMDRVKSEGKK
jgi:ribosomal protein L29